LHWALALNICWRSRLTAVCGVAAYNRDRAAQERSLAAIERDAAAINAILLGTTLAEGQEAEGRSKPNSATEDDVASGS
jgi:hypothetical protein